ncbi:MAG: AbrB/MazE/SpoVT family DNA-binding domain-containing protein [Bacilli bacterium]|nr:AbrB/MazE/SpoVT family DNA-binding domain-containing protein [Bacilli bacterium]
MENVNFIKNIDNLGRIVIPMDIRRKLQINTGDVLSISCTDKDIKLTKYSTLDNNHKVIEMLKYFIEVFNYKVILTNREYVLYSNVLNINPKLDGNMHLKVKTGTNMKYLEESIIFGNTKLDGIYNMVPIVTSEGVIGSLIVFGDQNTRAFDFCNFLAKLIMLELNIS